MKKQYSFEGLSLEETKEIFKKYRIGEISIDELVVSNINLVKKIVSSTFKNYKFSNFEFDDLIQEGCISLYKVILNYDENKILEFLFLDNIGRASSIYFLKAILSDSPIGTILSLSPFPITEIYLAFI